MPSSLEATDLTKAIDQSAYATNNDSWKNEEIFLRRVQTERGAIQSMFNTITIYCIIAGVVIGLCVFGGSGLFKVRVAITSLCVLLIAAVAQIVMFRVSEGIGRIQGDGRKVVLAYSHAMQMQQVMDKRNILDATHRANLAAVVQHAQTAGLRLGQQNYGQ